MSVAAQHQHSSAHEMQQPVRVKPIMMPEKFIRDKPATIEFQITMGKKILSADDLKEVHTQKIHVLIIDSSLNDYHHLHPQVSSNGKTFVSKFIPKTNNSYQMWVDITPLTTHKQSFILQNIGAYQNNSPIKGKDVFITDLNNYQFSLNFDRKPQVGQPVMATITVSKKGSPYKELEPVMGAFAHLVGFTGDHSSILHTHPMGKEPQNDADRGGPRLMFHLEFKKAGFVKLFAQFRIDGQDIFVPFSINLT